MQYYCDIRRNLGVIPGQNNMEEELVRSRNYRRGSALRCASYFTQRSAGMTLFHRLKLFSQFLVIAGVAGQGCHKSQVSYTPTATDSEQTVLDEVDRQASLGAQLESNSVFMVRL